MGKEKISIIIPVYNTERYLERCVYSALRQTHENIEVILIDDGSTDNSGKICDELKKVDSRIVVIHKRNGGVSEARNMGICAATGSYIGFVDSDDWIEPDMFMRMLRIALNNNAGIVCCGIRRDSEYCFGDAQKNEDVQILSILDAATLIWENGFMCNKLFRSQLFKENPQIGFDERICYVEDEPVLLKCVIRNRGMVITSYIGYHYFDNPKSASKQAFSVRKLSSLIGFKEMCKDVQIHIPELYDYFISKYYAICIGFYRYPETRQSPVHKSMIQAELRNNLLSILRLHNLKAKFKGAAILYAII